jgi:glycosyltransferase involved in cell wall biosynthesis
MGRARRAAVGTHEWERRLGLLIEITDVSPIEQLPSGLRGHHLDAPKQGAVVEARALDIAGWVVGNGSRAVAIELLESGRVVQRIRVDFPRPDVAAIFPGVPKAHRSGFRATVNLFGTTSEVDLELDAVLKDGRRLTLATLRGRRRWRKDPNESVESLASVVITCYNQAHFLAESIESALAQTYSPYEVVVVDDGSTDNTSEVARRYPDVRYIYQRNRGLAAARNEGLRFTNGSLLLFLDADDRLLPHALETGADSLRDRPECAFTWGHHQVISVDGTFISKSDQPLAHKTGFCALFERNYIEMHAAVLFRRGVFEHVRGYDESLGACEDYDLYFRVVKDFAIHCHGKVITEYRIQGSNLNRDPALMLQSTLRVLRSHRRDITTGNCRQAYRAGIERYRNHYGHELVRQTGEYLRQRRLLEAVRGLTVLARYHPVGLVSLLRRP